MISSFALIASISIVSARSASSSSSGCSMIALLIASSPLIVSFRLVPVADSRLFTREVFSDEATLSFLVASLEACFFNLSLGSSSYWTFGTDTLIVWALCGSFSSSDVLLSLCRTKLSPSPWRLSETFLSYYFFFSMNLWTLELRCLLFSLSF